MTGVTELHRPPSPGLTPRFNNEKDKSQRPIHSARNSDSVSQGLNLRRDMIGKLIGPQLVPASFGSRAVRLHWLRGGGLVIRPS